MPPSPPSGPPPAPVPGPVPGAGSPDAAPQAVAVDAARVAMDGDPRFGTVLWRTLLSADRTASRGLVAGIASFGAGGTLLPHRHAQPEMYFGLAGEGWVTVSGSPHRIGPGIALFIPGGAEHGTRAGEAGLSFLYAFPADSFAEVDYSFS